MKDRLLLIQKQRFIGEVCGSLFDDSVYGIYNYGTGAVFWSKADNLIPYLKDYFKERVSIL